MLSEFEWRTTEKNSSLDFMFLGAFHSFEIWMFFWKIYWGQVLNNSLDPPTFIFCNSLLYGLGESRELRTFISWILG